MGRRKILINQITDSKLRNVTFIKRRHGLIKKAAELSLLCNVNMLLIFEDGNGNLIQFSRNKITTIPSFFKECTYSSVSEFTANDYPNFFNPSHRRKRRGRKNDEELNKEAAATEQEDGFPILEGLPLLVTEAQSSQKGENITTAPASIHEGFMSPGMVSYSSSEEQSPEGRDEIHSSSNIQVRESYYNQSRQPEDMMDKPREIGGHYPEEPEVCLNRREACQNHKDMSMPNRGPIIEDKPTEYIQPHISNKRPMKRYFTEDGPNYYRNYYFGYNMPQYSDHHPHYWPYNPYYDRYPHGPLNFSYSMRPGPRVPRGIADEEVFDKMFKVPPKGFDLGSSNQRAERDEVLYRPANYVRNREKVVDYANPDYHQEIYPYQRSDYYSYGDNISSNLDYANSFESDSFNELSDPKKKLKQ